VDINEFRKQFYKARNAAAKHHIEGAKLNGMIDEYFGYHYCDHDIDGIIDCLLYGIRPNLTFADFMDAMKNKSEYPSDAMAAKEK
jgi:hypothetical protein